MNIEDLKNSTQNRFGIFRLFRGSEIQTFICPICRKLGGNEKRSTKVTKLLGDWKTPTGKTYTICNGCFGTAALVTTNPAVENHFTSTLEKLQ